MFTQVLEDKCSHILSVGILHSSPGESYTAGVFQVSVWRRGAKTLVGRKQKTVCHCPGRRPCAWPPLSWKCSKYQQTFSKYQQTFLRNFSWYHDHWYFDNWYFVTARGAVLALDHHRHRHGDRIPGSLTLSDTIFSLLCSSCLKSVMLYLLVLWLFLLYVFLASSFFAALGFSAHWIQVTFQMIDLKRTSDETRPGTWKRKYDYFKV